LQKIAYLISICKFELLDLSNDKSKWFDESALIFTLGWNDGNLEEKHWCIRILIKINFKTSYWGKSNWFEDDEHDVLEVIFVDVDWLIFLEIENIVWNNVRLSFSPFLCINLTLFD
jgi:hypothetical protein